ncbi:hypothetical protein AUR64_12150 [Haloprofundus marisrubri]|uniref:Intracellular proteinase inhibitor BsuPI domain-containing protein n=1 Tax=Haloprofundus marisrubri TaxID=1514971 RepID=A0A0W1RAF0_9EURY|nr:BsuPI-related putative proteinase inhibitor [Haloprofundus marisrubri]KTG10321.1 hypothetical protein AUR64_12150 [Haloprofundus marisrubri]
MLTATLTTTPRDDYVEFELTVENQGDESVTLSFRDARRAEFVVSDAAGDGEVWRWSDGRMFAQMLGSETLDAGESMTFEGVWDDPVPGEYVAIGELAAADADADAETHFSVESV